MFLENCWYVVAYSDEIPKKGTLARKVLGHSVVVYRTETGNPIAMLDRCPHRLVPLSDGSISGDNVHCPYHGMVFAPDGRCIKIPGQELIPDNTRVATFPVVEKHGFIWIWMGRADVADQTIIPDLTWHADRDWTASSGYTHFGADYRLINDNLLDLSHENYVHERTIGNAANESIAEFPPKVSLVDGAIVSVYREMPDITPPPFFSLLRQSDDRINRWQAAIWVAPSVNITDIGAFGVDEDRGNAFQGKVLHLLTPETETSTHYFWTMCRNKRLEDVELTRSIRQALSDTFDEDKVMLEKQQFAVATSSGPLPGVAIAVDDGPMRARRVLSSLIKKEKESHGVAVQPIDLLERTRQFAAGGA
jgi:phenylpropionate dioxygenase-like ring-hydroxylating dioxygenase large terminal subunit